MSNDLTMKLPAEIVERAVRDKITAAISMELGNPEELIQKMVNNTLHQKVNLQGNRSERDYDNNYDFFEVMAGKFIRDAAKEALNQYFKESKPKIVAEVKKSITANKSDIAEAFVSGLAGSLDCKYRSTVSINFNSNPE